MAIRPGRSLCVIPPESVFCGYPLCTRASVPNDRPPPVNPEFLSNSSAQCPIFLNMGEKLRIIRFRSSQMGRHRVYLVCILVSRKFRNCFRAPEATAPREQRRKWAPGPRLAWQTGGTSKPAQLFDSQPNPSGSCSPSEAAQRPFEENCGDCLMTGAFGDGCEVAATSAALAAISYRRCGISRSDAANGPRGGEIETPLTVWGLWARFRLTAGRGSAKT